MYVDEYDKISLKQKFWQIFDTTSKMGHCIFLGSLINFRVMELTLSFKDFETISMSYTMCVDYDFAP